MAGRAGPARRTPVEHLRHRLGRRHDSLGRIHEGLSSGSPTPTDLHDYHRELRRLRLDARPWLAIAPEAQRARWDAVDRRLKEIAGRIGAVRNFDVGLQLLDHLPRTQAEELASEVHALKRALAARAREGREALLATTDETPVEEFLDAVGRPLRSSLPGTASVRLARALDERITVQLARLERTLARAYRRPTVPRLHDLRIELRKLRTLDQTAVAVLHRPPLPFPLPLRSLQYDLGQLHDWDLLRENARELLSGKARGRLVTLLRTRVRAGRRRVRRLLAKKPVRKAFDALVRSGPD